MAIRPVFIPSPEGRAFVRTVHLEFKWFPGFAVSQKRKSIHSLHQSAQSSLGPSQILEVSSKSEDPLGVSLSAFNLTFTTAKLGKIISVESAFQASKVFEHGGPFTDLLDAPPLEAKKDSRLKSSGRLINFQFFGDQWELEPQTAFYDWVYINALRRRDEIGNSLASYQGFTDIEFNPEKSINCQAYSVALFESLRRRNQLDRALSSRGAFLRTIQDAAISNAKQDETHQGALRF